MSVRGKKSCQRSLRSKMKKLIESFPPEELDEMVLKLNLLIDLFGKTEEMSHSDFYYNDLIQEADKILE